MGGPREESYSGSETEKNMNLVVFIEIDLKTNGVSWFCFDIKDIPCTATEINGSVGFRKRFAATLKMTPIDNIDPMEWQRLKILENARLLTVVGYGDKK